MNLLLLFKAGWALIEEGLSLPLEKRRGFHWFIFQPLSPSKAENGPNSFLLWTLIHPPWDIYHNTVGICFLQRDRTELFRAAGRWQSQGQHGGWPEQSATGARWNKMFYFM